MIRALMNHALLFALLGGWFGVTQAAADPDLASEVSDVATLPPNPPHRFFTGGFREHSFVIFDADTGKMEGSIPAGYVFEPGHRPR